MQTDKVERRLGAIDDRHSSREEDRHCEQRATGVQPLLAQRLASRRARTAQSNSAAESGETVRARSACKALGRRSSLGTHVFPQIPQHAPSRAMHQI